MSALRSLCQTTQKLAHLSKSVKEDLQEIRASQKSAKDLLVELQAAATESVADVNGSLHSVSVVTRATRPAQRLEIIQEIRERWLAEGVEAWKQRVRGHPEEDLLASFFDASLVVWPPPAIRKSCKFKAVAASSARVADLPKVPASTLPLIECFLQARHVMAQRLASVREEKKLLLERKKELEQEAQKELAALPEDSFRKIELSGSEGQCDCFYMKLKKPRKRPPVKVNYEKLRKLLRKWIEEHCDVSRRDQLIETLSCKDSFETMLEDVRLQLEDASKPSEGPGIYIRHVIEDK